MKYSKYLYLFLAASAGVLLAATPAHAGGKAKAMKPAEVLSGLKDFYRKTAQPDGSFRPGIDPAYKGMSDCAASDLAAPTYAVILHKTFGWELPSTAKTTAFFLGRQEPDGAFVNRAGTMDPRAPLTRLYNTTQGLVALHALGVRPKYDPLPIFATILEKDYQTLPSYTTSFFPLAYLAVGKPFPPAANRKIRALMVQEKDGYLHKHIAATFHLAHYYRLVGEPTPQADAILARIMREQKPDGSWLLNPLARDRHAGFDAVFTLVQLGKNRTDCQKAIARAARWALSCRNADGGFGHYPGSQSDADAVYFQVGTLVLAGWLPVPEPRPERPHLLGWGHLMPTP